MPAVLSDELTFKHRIGIVQTPGKVVRVIDESLNADEGIVDKLVVGPIFEIANWRLYADDGPPGSATPLAAENTPITVGPGKDVELGEVFQLRFQLNELNIANPPLADYRFRRQSNGVSSDLRNLTAGDKIAIGNSATLAGLDGDPITVSALTSPGGGFETGEVISDINSPPRLFNHDFLKNGFTEFVMPLVVWESTTVDGDFFRIGIQLESGDEIFTDIIATVDEGVVADNPNEPAGFTAWLHHDCKTLPVHNSPASHVGWFETEFVSNYTIVSDTEHPEGTRDIIRIRYPTGHSPGQTPGRFYGFDKQGGRGVSTALSEWYIRIFLKIEDFHGDGTWEAPPNECKLYYNGVGRRSAPNKGGGLRLATNEAGITIMTNFAHHTRITHRACHDCLISVNTATAIAKTGDGWHDIEWYGKISDPGVANGIIRVWKDGTMIHENLAVQNQDSDNYTTGYFEFHWAPVYGGNSAGTKTRDDFLRLGHIYVSGVPQ